MRVIAVWLSPGGDGSPEGRRNTVTMSAGPRRWSAAAVVCVLLGATGWAQSLGELARREAERRRAIEKPGRVYTNDDLEPTPPPAAPAASPGPTAPPAAPAPAPAVATEVSAEEEEDRGEDWWRERIATLRRDLERAVLLQDALQSRINALTTDFTNRDDPAARELIAADRRRAIDELDRLFDEARDLEQQVADLEEEARRDAIPPGWLRP